MPPRKLYKPLLFCVTLALAFGGASEALAQSQDVVVPEEKFYASGNVFGYFESAQDGLSGSSFGGGASFGFYMRPRWTFGAEFAIPGYFTDDDDDDDLAAQQHRHIEIAALIGWHPARGTMTDVGLLIGLSYVRVESRSEELGDFTANRGALALGLDWRLPVTSSFAVVPQARMHVTTGTVVFRVGVGLQVDF
jgi:hypothetical protein